MFEDRQEAGKRLASALDKYKDENIIVLAIPKGGIEVGYHVAGHLNADFSVIVTRKLPFPDNPEAGFGAVAEDGSIFIFGGAESGLDKEVIHRIVRQQKQEIQRRIKVLRGEEPLPNIEGRIVVLVDDGMAMGSTMRASINLCRSKKAAKIVVAVPVAGADIAEEMKELVDELIVLEKPEFFRAVAQVYKNWYDVSDEEASSILEKWANGHNGGRSSVL